MDFFGIGAAMRAMVRVYQQSARHSGRTTSMLESLNDGDRIVFAHDAEARRVRQLCREMGRNIECVVFDPLILESVFRLGASQGRTIFDHGWVELFYQRTIERCAHDLDTWQRELSGYGEAHRATRRQAIELSKWRDI